MYVACTDTPTGGVSTAPESCVEVVALRQSKAAAAAGCTRRGPSIGWHAVYRYSYLLVRMREQRCWYLCCTVTRPLGSPAMATQICRDNGALVFAANHPLIHRLLLLFLLVEAKKVRSRRLRRKTHKNANTKSSAAILAVTYSASQMPHPSYDKPPIAGLIAAARFCLGLPTGHISAV